MPTNQRMQIRPADESDAELILELIFELADYENLAHEAVGTVGRVRETLFSDDPAAKVVIAEWDNQPAGFALYFTTYSTFLTLPGIFLEDLFVRPDFRNKSIGKALLVHLARLVHKKGWGRLEWSVLDWNRLAIDFYDGLGAYPKSEWTMYQLDGEKLAALANSEN